MMIMKEIRFVNKLNHLDLRFVVTHSRIKIYAGTFVWNVKVLYYTVFHINLILYVAIVLKSDFIFSTDLYSWYIFRLLIGCQFVFLSIFYYTRFYLIFYYSTLLTYLCKEIFYIQMYKTDQCLLNNFNYIYVI